MRVELCTIGALLIVAASVRAQPPAESQPMELPPDEAPAEPGYSPFTTPQLTGDWGGARTKLEESGVTFGLSLATVFQGNLHGGNRVHRSWRNQGNYLAELSLDTEQLKLWKGGTFYTLATGSWDPGVTDAGYTGDLFGVNGNANGRRDVDVFEAWYEHAFLDNKLRVKVGKLNLGSDFDANAYANDPYGQFLNNGLVNNPQIAFPGDGFGAIGAQLVAQPCDWFYAAAGVADAQGDSRETGLHTAFHEEDYLFSMYEMGLTPSFKTGRGTLPGNYRFGMWYDPQPKAEYFNDLGGRITTTPMKRDDVGFYLSFDQLVWKERPDDDADAQGLGWFFRYGWADGSANQIDDFWSTGGQYTGLVPGRDEDVLGFGVAQGIVTDKVRRARLPTGRETVFEAYYRIQVFPWLHIGPDFQWILNPGADGTVNDAFVAGVRFLASF